MAKASSLPAGMAFAAEVSADYASILTPEAIDFIAGLARKFEPVRERLLERRAQRQTELDARQTGFSGRDAAVRETDWTIAPAACRAAGPARGNHRTGRAQDADQRHSMPAPKCIWPTLEDSMTPTWHNVIEGQINLRDAVRRTHHLRQSGRQDLPAERKNRGAVRASARLAHGGETRDGGRQAGVRPACSISACISSTTRKPCWRAAPAPIFICPRWKAISKPACGTTCLFARRSS